MDHNTTTTTTTFSGLPPELWLRILHFAAQEDTPIIFRFSTTKSELQNLVTQPSILRTCSLFRKEGLPLWLSTNIFIVIGDKELPPSLEGRTGALPPALQAWIIAIGRENRETIKGLFITHFRALPVSSGFIDGSLVRYELVRQEYELFRRYSTEMDESGFLFRPWTYRVKFERFDVERVLGRR
jgi:hypothetical protein